MKTAESHQREPLPLSSRHANAASISSVWPTAPFCLGLGDVCERLTPPTHVGSGLSQKALLHQHQ